MAFAPGAAAPPGQLDLSLDDIIKSRKTAGKKAGAVGAKKGTPGKAGTAGNAGGKAVMKGLLVKSQAQRQVRRAQQRQRGA